MSHNVFKNTFRDMPREKGKEKSEEKMLRSVNFLMEIDASF